MAFRALEEAGCRWVTAHYLPGDVLLFNSLAIHQALPNMGDSLRLSTDFRYSGMTKEVVPDGLLPHGNIAPWSELYSGVHAAAAGSGRDGNDGNDNEYEWADPEGRFYWAAAADASADDGQQQVASSSSSSSSSQRGGPTLVARIARHFVGPESSNADNAAAAAAPQQFVTLHSQTPNVRLSEEARAAAIAASVAGGRELDPRKSGGILRAAAGGCAAAKL